jgi:hypothetical protein
MNSAIVYADPKDDCSPEEHALLEAVSSSSLKAIAPPTTTYNILNYCINLKLIYTPHQDQLKDAGVNPNHILNYRAKNNANDSEADDALDDLIEELEDPWMRNPMELPNFGFEEFTDLTPDALKEVVIARGGAWGKVPSPYAAFTDNVKEEGGADGSKSQGFVSYKDFISNNNNRTNSLPLSSKDIVVVVLIDVRRREEHEGDVDRGLLGSSTTISPIVKNVPLEELTREVVHQLIDSRNEGEDVRVGIVDCGDVRAQQACVRLKRVFGVEDVVVVKEWRSYIMK